jgi:hypothetical protein
MNRTRALAIALAIGAGPSACGKDVADTGTVRVELFAAAGDGQFGLANGALADELRVIAIDPRNGRGVADVEIEWRVVEGAGASLSPATSSTDEDGVASTDVSLGSANGIYRVEARTRSMIGPAAAFFAAAVLAPQIQGVQPATATAGESVTITGTNFSANAAENTVLFGGLRGNVTGASTTSLTVTVPACVPTRTLALRVALGAVMSAPTSFPAVASTGTPLQFSRGQARTFTDASELSCLRLTSESGIAFLVIPQNAAQEPGLAMPFELRGIEGGGLVTAAPLSTGAPAEAPFSPSDWELQLRARERSFIRDDPSTLLAPQTEAIRLDPKIGERRDFRVLETQTKSAKITAEVKAISNRAIIYQDVQAPANGFATADFEQFGRIFDDPIYPTDVEVFGQPSDIDQNAKIIILFTPKVNGLTPRSEASFIAGYFYGCDLVTAARCSDTNRAEIFYSMVPDPEGTFSGRRSKNDVLRTVPGVLAHEFQHMINFARKNESLDVLWLSEALAHAAEDIVGAAFLGRGDNITGTEFQHPNFDRANRYLRQVSSTAMISEASPGSLEMRGAAWLFLKYISGHYGENDLLGRLTRSSRTGAANVIAETGQDWGKLFGDFAVAVWADEATELQGASVAPHLLFPNLALRTQLGKFQGGFGLQPSTRSFQDFLVADELPSGSQAYVILQSTASPPPVSLALSGTRSGPLTAYRAHGQITLLRVR